jgi:hypothetical protein
MLIAGSVVISGCDLFLSPRPGKLVDTWVTANNMFRIRVNKHAEEHGGFVAGAYFVFQAAPKDQENWVEIMMSRHDDPIDIPRQQVRFVSDQVGYVFMGYKIAVTTDGGITWSVWDAVKNLPDWKLTRATIRDVQIEVNGDGIMKLTSFTDREAPILHTGDDGRTWQVN